MENAVNDAQQLCLHSEKASCKGKSLTDAQRQLLISEHNKIRRMIAKGNAENYDGGKLPSGRNIYQLRYSCELENAAIASVKGATCSASLADPQKYGQNIHVELADYLVYPIVPYTRQSAVTLSDSYNSAARTTVPSTVTVAP
ncbi:hypothetical protein Y032_0003g1633 [Ancylostoma ceylanicum]|uniref:SCP domain-containing protein n=1 Tax=Ancylostoma ceylanicum TaxID=53326 RepID=A0A016VZ18_9BILA|nr:hypothetical protein Y032_0003g1633 [Ancylostoma ceylanicum]